MVLVGKGAMIFQWNGPAACLHAMVDMWIFPKKNTCLILRSAEANEFALLIVLVEVIVLVCFG